MAEDVRIPDVFYVGALEEKAGCDCWFDVNVLARFPKGMREYIIEHFALGETTEAHLRLMQIPCNCGGYFLLRFSEKEAERIKFQEMC